MDAARRHLDILDGQLTDIFSEGFSTDFFWRRERREGVQSTTLLLPRSAVQCRLAPTKELAHGVSDFWELLDFLDCSPAIVFGTLFRMSFNVVGRGSGVR